MTTKHSDKKALLALFDDIDDDSNLSDEEVAAELAGAGIDVKKASLRLEKVLVRLGNARRREQLDRARAERLSRAHGDRLSEVRAMQLPLPVLKARVAEHAAHFAHRELDAMTREDLESQLADLLDLEEDE